MSEEPETVRESGVFCTPLEPREGGMSKHSHLHKGEGDSFLLNPSALRFFGGVKYRTVFVVDFR